MGMERRREGWLLVFDGVLNQSDCTKGVYSGRWAAAVEGVEFGGGGQRAKLIMITIRSQYPDSMVADRIKSG